MIPCCQKGCDTPALVATYWPSSDGPQGMCEDHVAWAYKLAEVMGFKLHIGPMDPLYEELAKEVETSLGGDDDESPDVVPY